MFCCVTPRTSFVGIWRRIRIESDREISQGVIKIVVTLRFDVCVSEPDATVQAVAVGPTNDWDAPAPPIAPRAA